jgi:hypothetical protein
MGILERFDARLTLSTAVHLGGTGEKVVDSGFVVGDQSNVMCTLGCCKMNGPERKVIALIWIVAIEFAHFGRYVSDIIELYRTWDRIVGQISLVLRK